MKTLDLHGKRHEHAKELIEDFILSNELPVKIITGNSHQMKQIVFQVINQHHMHYMQPNIHNLAEYIIYD